jgi:hypothetical protein
MTNNEWVRLVKEHEDKVREGIEAVIRAASQEDNCTIAATMNADGYVSKPFIETGIDGDVFAGEAIYICGRQASTDFEYSMEDLLCELTENQMADFLVWCQGNSEVPTLDTMEEWDKEIFDAAVETNIEDYIDATIDGDIEAAWVQLIEENEESD